MYFMFMKCICPSSGVGWHKAIMVTTGRAHCYTFCIIIYICIIYIVEITKVLNRIAKENGCEALLPWIKPCVDHLYWSVTTTLDGNGAAMWAKFESFLEHIANVHSNLPNPVFNKCAH